MFNGYSVTANVKARSSKPEKQTGEVDQISWLAKQAELIKIPAGGKTFALYFREF